MATPEENESQSNIKILEKILNEIYTKFLELFTTYRILKSDDPFISKILGEINENYLDTKANYNKNPVDFFRYILENHPLFFASFKGLSPQEKQFILSLVIEEGQTQINESNQSLHNQSLHNLKWLYLLMTAFVTNQVTPGNPLPIRLKGKLGELFKKNNR